MSQAELERQVSRLTGESRREVRRRGFSIVSPQMLAVDPDAGELSEPQVLDWDQVEEDRYGRAA
ncbi:MAG TPA: hypothetical protein VMP01_21490 [Pirellulaceae bacterium]|nr:hypothetical protein [Pirellulaceae bacterium]